jgi:alpha-L-fucosidase 2
MTSEDGWCSHHNTDLWRWSAYVHWGVPAAYWPLSGGWLSRNIYEKYLFDGDISYLAENFPILRGASRFFLDYMIETEEGKLVTSPATSAENTFIDPETGLPVGASEGSAIDQSIIREIFEHTLAAAELLDKEDPLLAEIQEALPRLEEHKIGSHGQILEFQHDYEEYDIHHRHVSHLYGAFPGSEFTPDRNPLLFEAAQKTLERRG